jgi:ABC-type glycerol-3-phosphate transport system substrate-binding protein
MNANTEQSLIERLKALSPERRAEVEDFIDFLQNREGDRRLVDAAARASTPVFKAVWDNDQDAAYDRL